jgi:choline kinase
MRAIIYAAGRATRLGRAYAHTPKILLPFGGRSLLDWHVGHLAMSGCREVVVVTGYEREQVAAVLPELTRRHGVAVTECPNPDFNEGSAISMLVSLPAIETAAEGLLLMDGDVLYHRSVLERLVTSNWPSVLLIDRGYSTADDDPVLVPIRAGRPFEFQKRWKGEAESVGESIGFFKLAAADVPRLAEETRRRAHGLGRLDSYDEIIRALVRAGRFHYEDVTGLAWTEIDFPHDIEHAESVVLPALLAGGSCAPRRASLAADRPR